jgi:hypothetical protein
VEQARTKYYECAGFAPDYLVGYLLVFWVFLTNTLIMNMLISMMHHTFDKQMETLNSVWLLDISKRIMRYEHNFCELGPRMQRNVHVYSIFSGKYWLSKLEDLGLILYCFPEIHRVALLVHLVRVVFTRYAQVEAIDRDPAASPGEPTWTELKKTIDKAIDDVRDKSRQRNIFLAMSSWLWHPHVIMVHRIHPTSLKAVVFGSRAEKHVRILEDQEQRAGLNPHRPSPGRLATLIYRLERLKEGMSNRKLRVHHDVPDGKAKGVRAGPVGWPPADARAQTGSGRGEMSGEMSGSTVHYPSPTAMFVFPFPAPVPEHTSGCA